MEKQTKVLATGVVLAGSLLTTSSLAIFFGIRAEKYRDQWHAARAEAQNLREKRRPVNSADPALIFTGTAPNKPSSETPNDNSAWLRDRIRELETALEAKGDPTMSPRQRSTNSPPDEAHRSRRPDTSLEELKNSDPEKYEEIMKYREEAKQRINDSFAEKAAQLLNKDFSGMTGEEKEEYNLMLQLLDETWKLADRLQSDPPREERDEIRKILFENMIMLEPMLKNERQREFYNLGVKFGYNEEEALSLVNYLNYVIDSTSMRNIYRSPHHGPPKASQPQDKSKPGNEAGGAPRREKGSGL